MFRNDSRPVEGAEKRRQWCWLLLAVLLIVGGVAGPDSLGEAHGNYLPQRVVLLGLVALVPVFDIDPSCRWGRGCVAALVAAVVLQSAVIWDYAVYSDRTAGQMIRARDAIGTRQRIAALLVSTRSRFRSNPLLHAVDWLGVDSGNIVWNNYETLHYYFPVQFRSGIDRPLPNDLEWVSLQEDPAASAARGTRVGENPRAACRIHRCIGRLEERPGLDAITARWFDRVDRQGDVQIYRRADIEAQLVFLLFLLELEEIGLVIDLGEILGAIFLAGKRDAESELFAVELVDSLG